MTLSIKDLLKYSGVFAAAFFTVAIFVQEHDEGILYGITYLKDKGHWQAAVAFALSGLASLVAIKATMLLHFADIEYFGEKLVPFLTVLLLAFGLTSLSKAEGYDPFPSVQIFWRYGCLAYGLFLLGPDTKQVSNEEA